MKSPNDQIKQDVIEARVEMIVALKKTGIYSDEWLLQLFGTEHLDVGDKWPT
jgi:hypothetical protein